MQRASGYGSDPGWRAEAVTPHASTNFTNGVCRGIYVGATGDVTAIVDSTVILFKAVPAGMILPIRATRVNAIGTTATFMVALF